MLNLTADESVIREESVESSPESLVMPFEENELKGASRLNEGGEDLFLTAFDIELDDVRFGKSERISDLKMSSGWMRIVIDLMEGILSAVIPSLGEDSKTWGPDSPVISLCVRVALEILLEDRERVWMRFESLDHRAGPAVCRPDGEGAVIRPEVEDSSSAGEEDPIDSVFSVEDSLKMMRNCIVAEEGDREINFHVRFN